MGARLEQLRDWWRGWRARRADERARAWLADEAERRAQAKAAASDEKGGSAGLLAAVLPILGATAGLAALATLAGGAMLWIRFEDLHLPANRAVALLPKELLVVVGAQALIVPTLIGIAVLLSLILIAPFKPNGGTRKRFWPWLLLPLAAAATAILWASGDLSWLQIWGLAVGALLGLVAIAVTAIRVKHVRYVALAVFMVAATFGATLSIVETKAGPTIEPVAIVLDPKSAQTGARGIAGFYIGETSDRLYFVPLPGNGDPGDAFAGEPIDRVVSITRSEVRRLVIREPIGTSKEDGGRDQAYTMLADLRQSIRARRKVADQPVRTLNPVVAFAPLVHLHSADGALPMSARGFIDRSTLRWASPEPCPHRRIAVGRQLGDPAPNETIDDAKLGRSRVAAARKPPYRESPDRPAPDRDSCAELPVSFPATARTRAFDKDRPTAVGPGGRRVTLDKEEGFYLDLDNDALKGSHDIDESSGSALLRNVPAYYEIRPARVDGNRGVGKRRYQRLTYWFLYGVSDPPPSRPEGFSRLISHEGDWERISVLLLHRPKTDVYFPISVRYHFHDDDRDVPWDAVRRTIGDGTAVDQAETHPVVYSALGSHASYPRAGRVATPYAPNGKDYFEVYDDAIACPMCPQWQTWKLLVDARSQLWYGFGGAWGAVRGQAFRTGPLGPSRYKLGPDEGPPTKTVGPSVPVPTAPPGLIAGSKEEPTPPRLP